MPANGRRDSIRRLNVKHGVIFRLSKFHFSPLYISQSEIEVRNFLEIVNDYYISAHNKLQMFSYLKVCWWIFFIRWTQFIRTRHYDTKKWPLLSDLCCRLLTQVRGKSVPLQAWSGPEGSRMLRFPDFMTTAQEGGKVVSLTHRPHLPPGNPPGTHFC